jgi:UDP-glucuronate 4-epimerase
LESCRVLGLKRLVFASSSSVYGGIKRVPFRVEDAADRPVSPYAATKREGELICYTYHHLYGINVSCLRFFTVYGPRQRPEMAIHKFTRLIHGGRTVPLFGDGSSQRDYTYIDDIIDGVVATVERPFPYEIFNLGDAHPVPLPKLVALIEQELGKKARKKWLPDQPGDVPITYADISHSTKLLGYQPRIPIEDGIRRFVRWYRERH